MFNLKGKRALVTGGSRGIGKEIAKGLISMGAEVVIAGSNAIKLEETAKEIGASDFVVADLADMVAIDAMIEKVGAVDILVNNAGITRDGLFVRQSEDMWNEVLRVNLDATVRITRGVVSKMSKNRFGRVINISSVVAHMGNVGQTNYITSKAAITGFTKGLSTEVARRNVTVNCIAPGFIETAMTQELGDAVVDDFKKKIPAGRFGHAEEVAAAVCFLASAEAGYITGTTLHVNGGLYM